MTKLEGVIPRVHPSEELLRLARAQAGVVTTEQAEALGFHREQLRRVLSGGSWQRILPGTFYTHDSEPPWSALCWAGVLRGGDEAVLCLDAAAHLLGFAPVPEVIDILQPLNSRHRSVDPWRFHRASIMPRGIGNPSRTTATRTVLDLCRKDPDRMVHWVTTAVGGRHTTIARLRAEFSGYERFPQRRTMELLLSDVAAGAHSPLEVIYLRDVERAHGLPVGRRQSARGLGFVDVYYDEGLIVELDGRRGHEGGGRFRDMNRDNANMRQGIPTLRFGWDQCAQEPCLVAAEVSSVLTALGSTTLTHRCRRCRAMAA